jgi:hypothetical protein
VDIRGPHGRLEALKAGPALIGPTFHPKALGCPKMSKIVITLLFCFAVSCEADMASTSTCSVGTLTGSLTVQGSTSCSLTGTDGYQGDNPSAMAFSGMTSSQSAPNALYLSAMSSTNPRGGEGSIR